MVRKVASAVFLLVGIAIALGAYGHGFVGRLGVDAELAKVQIAPSIFKMLYVVWYFRSGCMLVFGATIIWAWRKVRRGETALVPIVCLIGALYVTAGVGGMIYRDGDPFMATFIVLGGLLLVTTFVLTRRHPAPRRP